MPKGPNIPPVQLTTSERETLERWTPRATTAQALVTRARIVLTNEKLHAVPAVARELRLTRPTVARWRHRFVARRLDGLLDEPRPGAPRTISDADVERGLVKTLESTPRDGSEATVVQERDEPPGDLRDGHSHRQACRREAL